VLSLGGELLLGGVQARLLLSQLLPLPGQTPLLPLLHLLQQGIQFRLRVETRRVAEFALPSGCGVKRFALNALPFVHVGRALS
jgi:hypothetical protein